MATDYDAPRKQDEELREDSLEQLKASGIAYRVIFLEATREALVKRYESNRRPHPLQGSGTLIDGIAAEERLLAPLRATADQVIDTSGMSVHDLTRHIRDYVAGEAARPLQVTVESFGFKHGLPLDADHVVDVRFLKNPYWVDELRHLTGRDQAVADYVLDQPGARDFALGYADLLAPMLDGYLVELKPFVTIAVGCTGGKHRSVACAELIAQRLRDAETDRVLGSFKGKQGEVVSGVVQQNPRHDSRDLLVDVGEHEAIMRVEEQVPTERFRHGDHIRALVLEVSVGTRGASVRLSRTHPDFARKLFEMEVPEIQDGTVEIVALAREAGHRAKIAVWSDIPDVNAKGACIGHNGQRVRAVTTELGGEKIDIVDYDDDPKVFIAASLSPAKVVRVDILDKAERQARAIVPDGQTSLAIGKEAQNVRLAAKLTGWSIDIRKESDDLDDFDD